MLLSGTADLRLMRSAWRVGIALILLLMAFVFSANGNTVPFENNYYKKLLAQYFISLKEDELSKDLSAKAEDLTNIGNIFFTLKNYDKALTYYKMAQQTYNKMAFQDGFNSLYFPISKVFSEIHLTDSSHVCLEKSIAYFKSSPGNLHNLMYAYLYSGELFQHEQDYKASIQYFDSALAVSSKVNSPRLFLSCLHGKSQVLFLTKDYKRSLQYSIEGLSLSNHVAELSFSLLFRHLLYLNYKNLNNPERAFKNLEAYHYLNDSLQSSNAKKAFIDMTSSYASSARESENEILKQQNKNYGLARRLYITALVLGLLLVSTLASLAFQLRKRLRFNHKVISHQHYIKARLITTIDREKKHKDELISNHQEELETVFMEKNQITNELERKNNDLLMAATYMIKTNEKLAEISSNFKDIASRLQKSSTINGEIYQNIEAIEKLSSKDTWESFRSKFVDVHPNFFKNLNDRCPGLTQNEMKLAAMISMNLSSKDIAKITLQQHNSVNVARYRLRKKLNMDNDEQLIGYLLQL